MIREQHLKAGTVQALHSLLYQMFETAVMDKLIRDNPTANALQRLRRMFHTEQEQRHALTVQEQEELIRYVHRSGRYRRMAPLVTVLLGTGMRIGEALGLRWSDCDFEEGIIHVDHAPVLLPQFSAHILQHTFCTRLCENGTNVKVVQDVMGHKNIRTTMDVYNEATGEQKRKSFREIEEKLPLLPPETEAMND